MQRLSSALFLLGLGLLIAAILRTMEFGSVPPIAGQAINAAAADTLCQKPFGAGGSVGRT